MHVELTDTQRPLGDSVRAFADDKVLFLTEAPLATAAGPLGEPPCHGYSEYGGRNAVVTLTSAKCRI